VIFDTPPVLGLPDTVTLVDLCDAALFVVGAGGAQRDDVESALERLDASKVVGLVLNRCDSSEVPFEGAYGYSKS
jgi:receptor protein-tyrosine kinase